MGEAGEEALPPPPPPPLLALALLESAEEELREALAQALLLPLAVALRESRGLLALAVAQALLLPQELTEPLRAQPALALPLALPLLLPALLPLLLPLAQLLPELLPLGPLPSAPTPLLLLLTDWLTVGAGADGEELPEGPGPLALPLALPLMLALALALPLLLALPVRE